MAFLLSDYDDIREIGRGGMGRVYVAIQRSLNRTVVIKEMISGLVADQSQVRRFENEAKSAAALNHPNIIRVYDFGADRNSFYIVMEYVDGPSLEQLLARQDMPREMSLMVLLQALKGLHSAHQQHIVHRDVKPGNILVTMSGQAKIMDFGLAHAGSQALHLTATEAIVGTPQYMSPEQANGVEIKDARTDVFSSGAVAYQVLSGTLPFTGNTIPSVLFNVTQTPEKSLFELVPTVPEFVAKAVHGALIKDPALRMPTLEPLIAALQQHFYDIGVPDTMEMVRLCLIDPQHGAGQLYGRLLYYHLRMARELAAQQEVDRAKAHLEKALMYDPGNSEAAAIGRVISGGTTILHRLRRKKRSPEAQLLARERGVRVPWARIFAGMLILGLLGGAGWYGWRFVPQDLKNKGMKALGMQAVDTKRPAPLPPPPPSPEPGAPAEPVTVPVTVDTQQVVAAARPAGQAAVTRPGITKTAVAKGKVIVRMDPAGGVLMVDGKPVKMVKGTYEGALGTGKHMISAVAPGHDRFSRAYDIRAGTTQIIEIALKQVDVKVQTGTLHVHSYPWAELFVDGRYKGNTPTAEPLQLEAGRHSVVLTRNGYHQYEQMIDMKAGAQERIKVDMVAE